MTSAATGRASSSASWDGTTGRRLSCSPRFRRARTAPRRSRTGTSSSCEALADGNVGGEEVVLDELGQVRDLSLPRHRVKKGDFIVLHLAPEGIPAERDELGSDLSVSGGVDAIRDGRDLWCASMGCPTRAGPCRPALRPGSPPMDGLFYADDSKSGALSDDKLADMLSTLSSGGAWPLSGSFARLGGWRSAGTARPNRSAARAAQGPSAWYVTASGGQSPGDATPARIAAVVKSAPNRAQRRRKRPRSLPKKTAKRTEEK
jgi:hypothetical protein